MALSLTLLAGAKLYFYVPGSTTPRNTYTDSALTIPHANPVVADSGGRFPAIYLNPAQEYKCELKTSAGELIDSEEKVSAQTSYQLFQLPWPVAVSSRVALIAGGISLTRALIGETLTPRTALEIANSITPVDDGYIPGHIQRYSTGVGVTDSTADTAAFTAAFTSGHPVILPKLANAYRFTGPLLIPSNTVIWCEPGVQVLMPDGGLPSDIGWIRMRDVDNITIHGNGSTWGFVTKPTANEQRHVFDIRGASNVRIRDTIAVKAGGDGYYVGAGSTNDFSENIYLENIQADNCRRQGMSAVSFKNLWVNGALFENIIGTSPQAGLDIESNAATDEMTGGKFSNIVTRNCAGAGIAATINDLPADYKLDIVIENHSDDGSLTGFLPQRGTQMRGRIRNVAPQYINSGESGIEVRSWATNSAHIEIIDPYVLNPNVNNVAPAYAGHGISVFNPGSDGALDIGNVTIVRPRIVDNRGGSALMKDCIYARNLEASGVLNKVRVFDPVELSGNTAQVVGIRFGSTCLLRDQLRLTKKDLTSNANYGDSYLASVVTNEGASGTVVVSLVATHLANAHEVTFEVRAAQAFRMDPDASSGILPGSTGNGKYIGSSTIGNSITLRRDSSTTWYITKMVGTWAFEP
jgi:hypothetical protein